jgi:PAS domain S-box-containing protein
MRITTHPSPGARPTALTVYDCRRQRTKLKRDAAWEDITPTGKCKALAQSESPDAVVVLTARGEILHWGAAAEALFGFQQADAVGRRLSDLIVPDDLRHEEASRLAVAGTAGTITFESLRQRKDGSRLYVCITTQTIPNPDGGDPLLLSTNRDVTQLRVLRDAQRIEFKYRDLLESVPDAVVIVNPAGHIVYVNEHSQRLFGYAPEALMGEPIEVLLPERFRGTHLAHRVGYFSQPRPRSMGIGLELFGLRKDGSEFPVDIGLSPLQVEDTTLTMSAIRDISVRKQIELELRKKNVALENANRAKTQFLASMSHELRTPLNSIIGFTGTLLMRMPGPINEGQEKQLRTVQTSARHLLSLINDLLDLAKIEADRLELELEPVDSSAVLREVSETLMTQAEQKKLQFTVNLPQEPVYLKADRRALSQVLINLTDNAIKFTDYGSVRLTLARRADSFPKQVEIRIEDTGPGMRNEDVARAFDPFTRFGVGDRIMKAGTGLGLHLSQKLAAQMEGRILCESRLGHGTTFTLVLLEA